jgi:hypothetical protein
MPALLIEKHTKHPRHSKEDLIVRIFGHTAANKKSNIYWDKAQNFADYAVTLLQREVRQLETEADAQYAGELEVARVKLENAEQILDFVKDYPPRKPS